MTTQSETVSDVSRDVSRDLSRARTATEELILANAALIVQRNELAVALAERPAELDETRRERDAYVDLFNEIRTYVNSIHDTRLRVHRTPCHACHILRLFECDVQQLNNSMTDEVTS